MCYVICPECGHRIEIFGPSRAQETALQSKVPLLGSLPLDPDLAILCDQGKAEDYLSDGFEQIADKVLEGIAFKRNQTET
jgi:hypothetical protein